MKVDLTNLFRVRRDGSGDIALPNPVPTRLTRGQALNLAVWLVAFADGKAASGDSEFAVMLQGVVNTESWGASPGQKLRGNRLPGSHQEFPTRIRTAEASIEVARPLFNPSVE